MSFDTLLSEFVVVRCNTLSMLVKARWASPIHSFAAASAASTASGVRACEKLCDVARLSVRLRALRTPRLLHVPKVGTREVLHTAPRDQLSACGPAKCDFALDQKPVLRILAPNLKMRGLGSSYGTARVQFGPFGGCADQKKAQLSFG